MERREPAVKAESIHAPQAGAKVSDAGGGELNPIRHFESALERVWHADVGDTERAAQLARIGDSIDHYLKRIKPTTVGAQENSEWERLKLERAKEYLAQLARDSRQLAHRCNHHLAEMRA